MLLFSCTTKKEEAAFRIKGFRYARLVSVDQKLGYKELIVRNPKSLKVESKYALIPRNSKVKRPSGMKIIEIPVQNMAVLSTSFIGMLDAVNSIETIKATTEEQYISNKALLRGIHAGKVLVAGYETGLTPEAVLKAGIPLIVFSGFGQPFPNEAKFAQLKVVCMANYDWEEVHPLGKAEWIKVFGALVDKDKEAEAYFSQVEEDYLKIRKEAQAIKQHKKVICGGLAGDVWYAPAGKSFMAGIMKDAGMDYFYKNTKGTASLSLTFEQVFNDDQQCDLWINAEAPTFKKLFALNPKFRYFHTVKQGKVFTYTHNSNYFWENSPANPHWLLEDFVHIARGDQNVSYHFYRQLR
jgi:iron complex transport system substrate-binding protein